MLFAAKRALPVNVIATATATSGPINHYAFRLTYWHRGRVDGPSGFGALRTKPMKLFCREGDLSQFATMERSPNGS
jgi:hypothetical protein